jgi:gingipain R
MKTLKNVVLLTFLLLLSATDLFASQGFEVSFNQPVSSEYDLEFELGDYRLSETQKNGKMFTKIDFASSVVTNKKGFAALPYIHASVQISPDRNVTTQIVSSDYVEYELAHPLVPSRGIIYRNQDPSTIPYEIDRESIVDEFYPVNISQTTEPYILRDIRGVNVYVYPFQYNAAQNILRVYTNVTVKLTDDNTMPINPITSFSRTIMRDMHHMYSTIFINYDRTRFENELADFGSILVIHTPRDAVAILPYIEWKREKGHTVYVEEVATGTNVISLVSSQYTAHNDILYVQLVGDWADIQGATSGGAAADPNLGCVVGGDDYPDMIVGRFSANSETHVTTQVNKTITYERDPDMGADWYYAAIGIASNQGPGDDNEDDDVHIQNIWFHNILGFFRF